MESIRSPKHAEREPRGTERIPGLPAPTDLSLRELVDVALRSVDPTGGDERPAGAQSWARLRCAQEQGTPVRGRIVLTVEAGAFLSLGGDTYGFVRRSELPDWVPDWPRRSAIGRELEGLVVRLDEASGAAYVSPRLLAVERARALAGAEEPASGEVVSVTAAGAEVDLRGARGFAPRGELDADWLAAAPGPGTPWRGYVMDGGADDGALALSHFGPGARRERAERRVHALAALAPGATCLGRVVGADPSGALVAFEDGLVTGLVPRPALAAPAAEPIARDALVRFRVVGAPSRACESQIDVYLWPLPRHRSG